MPITFFGMDKISVTVKRILSEGVRVEFCSVSL